jgi:membrane-associated phospholipid phosphatase
LSVTKGIRAAAWVLVAAGVAAPAFRRRLRLPPALVMATAGSAPLALCLVRPRDRIRDVAVCALNMWAYLAAYEMPHDDPRSLASRVRVRYPIVLDRMIGLGVPPTLRLQRGFSSPGLVNRFERLLVWCHWSWFAVPHGAVGYVLMRRPERFPAAAARMYATFDIGAVFYWSIPTAPPWWAAAEGYLEDRQAVQVRRMMIEYGEQFWGDRWGGLYDVLGGNPLAAMPSLHFATSLMAAHLMSEVGPISGLVGWTYTSLLGLALVYLGEHYAADIIAGGALAEAVRLSSPRFARPAAWVSRAVQGAEARLAAG